MARALSAGLAAAILFVATAAEARRVCARNDGGDPVGVRAAHAMYWIDGGGLRCFNTDADTAILQNDAVSECLERDVIVELREHACLVADGEEGVCVPKIETLPFAHDCESG